METSPCPATQGYACPQECAHARLGRIGQLCSVRTGGCKNRLKNSAISDRGAKPLNLRTKSGAPCQTLVPPDAAAAAAR